MTIGPNIAEVEFVDWLRAIDPADRARCLGEVLDDIVAGERTVVTLQSEPLDLSIFFANLLRSIDAVSRYDLVNWATSRMSAAFVGEQAGAPDVEIEALLSAAGVLLVGDPRLSVVVEYAWNLVAQGDDRSGVTLAAARLLYDLDALGDNPEPWMALVVKKLHLDTAVAVAGLSALMKKWPFEGFEFLLAACTQVEDGDEVTVLTMANLISISSDEIADGVGHDVFEHALEAYAPRLPVPIREALNMVAIERGWLPDPTIEGSASRALVPLPMVDTTPVRIIGRARNKEQARQLGEALALRCRFDQRSTTNAPFPDQQIDTFCLMRREASTLNKQTEWAGFEELAFVRSAVEDEIRWQSGDLADSTDEELLKATQRFVSVNEYARVAAGHLRKLNFDKESLLLGASEFHQDRLLMHLTAAALQRVGLLGVKVVNRAWEETGLLIESLNKEAHLKIEANVVTEPTDKGVFEFTGFRVFIRMDALQDPAIPKSDEVADDIRKLEEAVAQQNDVRSAVDLQTRARLVLRLGEVHAKGSAFEQLAPAVGQLAGLADSHDVLPVEINNDDAFEAFITGKSAIYCGGAINSLLIETWWQRSQPDNFIELLNHEEIARGWIADGDDGGSRTPYVENALRFKLVAGNANKRNVQLAEQALVKLFRAVGRGLKRWSVEVMNNPDSERLKGRSCEAARRILRPMHTSRSGKYAFATLPTDPARLVKETDRFYDEVEKRAMAK